MNPFSKGVEWVKSNPIPTALIVTVGGIVVFVILSGSGGGGVTATSVSGPSDAQIAADAQLQALRIQGADAASARQAQVQLGQYQRDIELAQTEASLAAIEDTNETNVAVETIRSTRDQNLAQLNYEQAVRGYQAQEVSAGYAYQSAAVQSNAALEAARLNTEAAVTIQTINNQTQLDLANIQANVDLTGLAVQERGIQNVIGGQITVAQINANSQLQLAQQETRQIEITANNERRANRDSGIFGAIGGIAGAIGSIFSDSRMKRNITFEGYDPQTELPMYSYTMGDEWRLGFMAHDVVMHYPDAAVRGPGDSMMYDPRMLN